MRCPALGNRDKLTGFRARHKLVSGRRGDPCGSEKCCGCTRLSGRKFSRSCFIDPLEVANQNWPVPRRCLHTDYVQVALNLDCLGAINPRESIK